MKTCIFELPYDVNFEVPRPFASYCQGTIVQIGASTVSEGILKVSWDDKSVLFESNGECVLFVRKSFIGLVVNASEEVMGQSIGTLRVIFCEPDGTKGLLPVLSTTKNVAWLESVLGKLRDCGVPGG